MALQRPKFLYFDLGNVLLHFDHHLACRQIADVAGVSAERVWQIIFAGDLETRYEAGQLDDDEFYELFCRHTGTRPDRAALLRAASEIFELNTSIVPLVAALSAAGNRMGVLSNTCGPHWAYCTAVAESLNQSGAPRYGILTHSFDVFALSYQIGACKPDPAIFAAAARLAGCAPGEIFFVDDIAGHVAGARAAGFDAVQYTTTAQLAADLRARGLRFNY
jgi:glucose-1-phosphatase